MSPEKRITFSSLSLLSTPSPLLSQLTIPLDTLTTVPYSLAAVKGQWAMMNEGAAVALIPVTVIRVKWSSGEAAEMEACV